MFSAWGENSQWFKNIQQCPEVEIEVGGRLIRATAIRLSELQAEQELRDYARRHPTAYRTIGRLIFGEQAATNAEEFARLAKMIPILVLRARKEEPACNPAQMKNGPSQFGPTPPQTAAGSMRRLRAENLVGVVLFTLSPARKSLREGDEDDTDQRYDQSYRGHPAVRSIQIVKVKQRAQGAPNRGCRGISIC